eukprot:6181891-Pleurochrysis_carterae.AAC.2
MLVRSLSFSLSLSLTHTLTHSLSVPPSFSCNSRPGPLAHSLGSCLLRPLALSHFYQVPSHPSHGGAPSNKYGGCYNAPSLSDIGLGYGRKWQICCAATRAAKASTAPPASFVSSVSSFHSFVPRAFPSCLACSHTASSLPEPRRDEGSAAAEERVGLRSSATHLSTARLLFCSPSPLS